MMHHHRHRPAPDRPAARPGLKRRLLILPLIVAVLGGAPSVLAASTDEPCGVHFGDTVIAEGQSLDCDVVVVGGSALVEAGALVDGSLNAVPGSVRILGEVTGDVSAARDIAISGDVGGNAFAIGGDIEIDGTVGANATAARGNISLSRGAEVEGQVSARGDVTLAEGARVGGDVVAGGQVAYDGVADVDGQITEGHAGSGYASMPGEQDPQTGVIQAIMALAVIILAVLFATLTAMAAPGRVATLADAASGSPMLMVLLGLIALLATLPALFLVIPLFLAPIALAFGWVGLGQAWGRRVAPRRSAVQQTAVGSLLLAAIAVLAIVTMFGLPRFAVVCGIGLLLLIPIAWAYAAGIATWLGSRPFKRGAAAALPAGTEDRSPFPAPSEPGRDAPTPEEAAIAAPSRPADDAVPGVVGEIAVPTDDFPVVDLRPIVPGAVESAPVAPAPAAPHPTTPNPTAPHPTAPDPAAPDPFAPTPEAALPVAPAPVEAPHDEVRHGPALRQVLGLSPIYAELLRSAGVKGARDLAALSPDEAARLTAAPGVLPVPVDKAAAWIRAARALLSEAG